MRWWQTRKVNSGKEREVIFDNDINEKMVEFICEKGMWSDFLAYLKSKGFTDEEIEEME
jgi:hypothetical protein